MKKIEAMVRPEKLDDISAALMANGHNAMTVTQIHGRGEQRGIALQFRGKEVMVNLIPKVKIELILEDTDVEEVIGLIKGAAHTGMKGDGKIFVSDIERAIAIRE